MYASKIEWSHCGGSLIVRCFECGTTENLILINERNDNCVGGSEEVRCGLCWAKRHLRRIEELTEERDSLLAYDEDEEFVHVPADGDGVPGKRLDKMIEDAPSFTRRQPPRHDMCPYRRREDCEFQDDRTEIYPCDDCPVAP